MDGQCRPPILPEVFSDVVGDSLRTDEDQNLSILLTDLVEMLDELRAFFKLSANFNELVDVVVGCQLHRSDVDLDEVLKEILEARDFSNIPAS